MRILRVAVLALVAAAVAGCGSGGASFVSMSEEDIYLSLDERRRYVNASVPVLNAPAAPVEYRSARAMDRQPPLTLHAAVTRVTAINESRRRAEGSARAASIMTSGWARRAPSRGQHTTFAARTRTTPGDRRGGHGPSATSADWPRARRVPPTCRARSTTTTPAPPTRGAISSSGSRPWPTPGACRCARRAHAGEVDLWSLTLFAATCSPSRSCSPW
jgi:hypothetical protein